MTLVNLPAAVRRAALARTPVAVGFGAFGALEALAVTWDVCLLRTFVRRTFSVFVHWVGLIAIVRLLHRDLRRIPLQGRQVAVTKPFLNDVNGHSVCERVCCEGPAEF